jgi:enoyl-CoA hydratase
MIELVEHSAFTLVRMAHGKANAFDRTFLAELTDALERVGRSDCRAAVLTGTGAIFSAGVDLVQLRDGGPDYARAFLPALSECFRVLVALPKPIVAAVNGHAIAGGCILACACDHRLMVADHGRIGVPEHQVGVPFPWLVLEIMRHALPPPQLESAVLLGDTYRPPEALARGFVHELAAESDLLPRAEAVAARLGAIPPESFRITKQALRAPLFEGWARHGPAHDARVADAWASDAVHDALTAYVEKTLHR